MEQLTFWSGGLLAKGSALQENAEDCGMNEVGSLCSTLKLLEKYARNGSSGKTSPAVFQLAGGKTSLHSFQRCMTAGIVTSLGLCLTHNTLEYRSAAAECSLSDILEKRDVPPKYFLSPKACEGILRRAQKRRQKIPDELERCLQTAADSQGPQETATN